MYFLDNEYTASDNDICKHVSERKKKGETCLHFPYRGLVLSK